MRFSRQEITGDRGASMVEYGLLVAVIALMALTAVTLLGERTEETFTTVAAELEGQDSDLGANNDSEQESDDSSHDQNGNTGGQNQDDQDQDDQSQDDDSDDQNGSDNDSDDQNDDDDSHDQQGDDSGDDSGNSGDDSGNSGDDSGNSGDDSGNSGGSDEDEDAGTDPVVSSINSEFYWWNDTKHGGNGAWTASVSYSNDTNRHQYLDLRIIRVDEKGKESVSTYNNFYVPAGGSTTYTHWNNNLEDKNGKLNGTVKVKVEVTKVRTSDQNWQTVSYEVNGKAATVEAPSTK